MHFNLRLLGCCVLIGFTLLASPRAQETSPAQNTYTQLRAFKLGSTTIKVQNLKLDRDGVQMTFSGDFHVAEPVEGGIYGAVFLGQGQLHHEPELEIEKESVRRFLNSPTVDSTFTKAVLRFSDDTYQRLSEAGVAGSSASGSPDAQKLAAEFGDHLVRETGVNLASRLLQSIVNKETPGLFFAEVDGGSRGRFSVVVDHQSRIPANAFDVNGGEKGLIFKYEDPRFGNDIWTAFYDASDLNRGTASYSDAFDLVSIPQYQMDIDLRDPGNWLRYQADLEMTSLTDNLRVIPMRLNDGLDEQDNERRNKGVRVLRAWTGDGAPVGLIQDEWETGFTLILPATLPKGRTVHIKMDLQGKDSLWSWGSQFHYPRSTTSWYPRHGYLARSKFDLVYHHDKKIRVASVGERVSEGADKGDEWITEWKVNDPVALVAFVCGPFERHEENTTGAGRILHLEYYSPPGAVQAVKEDFILGEIGNAVKYFENLFGDYPYGRLGGAYFPTSYGQGFPTLLLLPVQGYANRNEFSFMAHENSHQWWGNIVGWRSYRDQWLSEGFAEYSGVLYTALRSNKKDALELVKEMRRELVGVNTTVMGTSKDKLYEVGPLTLGYRLNGTRSTGAGELLYAKGALVLRMLHFLLSDPATLDDTGFFDMMKDFVSRHRNGVATSESFIQVAGEHFARAPIGQKYQFKNLNWFLSEWIYQTGLPDYHLDYKVESRDGGYVLKGTLLQQNVPDNWVMALPVQVEFDRGVANTVILASGPSVPVEIRLPAKPKSVRLDPDLWALSGKTSEKGS